MPCTRTTDDFGEAVIELSDAQAEAARLPFAIALPMYKWLAVHGYLMLALRHPMNNHPGAPQEAQEDIRLVCHALEEAFIRTGMLTAEFVAEMRANHAQT